MENLKIIKYKRLEYLSEPQSIERSLLIFVYDVPYFDACGIFPPFHIINQIFLSGGGDGGMSPGASWEPFSISENEYAELINAVRTTPIEEIKPHARYAWVSFQFDPEFDQITDRHMWMKEVCEKHRDEHHSQLRKIAERSNGTYR